MHVSTNQNIARLTPFCSRAASCDALRPIASNDKSSYVFTLGTQGTITGKGHQTHNCKSLSVATGN